MRGLIEMDPEVAWLASVLEARNFPVDRLARNLDIAAEVIREHVAGDDGERLAAVLRHAAASVRSRNTGTTELGPR